MNEKLIYLIFFCICFCIAMILLQWKAYKDGQKTYKEHMADSADGSIVFFEEDGKMGMYLALSDEDWDKLCSKDILTFHVDKKNLDVSKLKNIETTNSQ